jgi:hypothetical protein
MKPSEELSQPPLGRYPGGSVTRGRGPGGSPLPSPPFVVSPSPRRPCGSVVGPALPPAVLVPGTAVAHRISIAEKAGFVVPSN